MAYSSAIKKNEILHLICKRSYGKGPCFTIISLLGRLNILRDFWALYFLYENCFCMFFVLHTGTWMLLFFLFLFFFFSFFFFFCCMISFIIYFISSCEIKAQELYSILQKKGRMKHILNTLRGLLAKKKEIYATSLSSFFPSPSQVYQTPFHPKLLTLVWIPCSSLSFFMFYAFFQTIIIFERLC